MSLPENEGDAYDGAPQERASREASLAAQRDAVLRQILEPDARSRLANIRLVKPELASAVENYMVSMAAQRGGQLRISDDQLKQILLSAQQPRREFRFGRA